MIDIDFKFLKITLDLKARSRENGPQARTTSETIVSIFIRYISRNFNSKMMRPCCQFSPALKFWMSEYQIEKLIKTITMQIFIEKAERNYMNAVEMWHKPRWSAPTKFQIHFSVFSRIFKYRDENQTIFNSNILEEYLFRSLFYHEKSVSSSCQELGIFHISKFPYEKGNISITILLTHIIYRAIHSETKPLFKGKK